MTDTSLASSKWLSLAVHHARMNAAAEHGSAESTYEAQAAIFYLMQHLGGITNYASVEPGATYREGWVATLTFLLGTQSFPGLSELSVALQELDRGVLSDALQPKAGGRRGGVSDTTKLQLMSYAVEAANELRRMCVGVEDYHAELSACGCPHRTLDGYRVKVAAGPPEMRPRSSYVIFWGDLCPRTLLRRAVEGLARKRQGV